MTRRGLALVVALAVGVTTAASTGSVNADVRRATAASSPGQQAYQVTLITGDVVRAAKAANGAWSFGFEPASRGEPADHIQYPTRDGDWYVIPREAARLVGSGLLDRELFNVTSLIEQRYDDSHSDTVPLLVEYPDAAAAERAETPPGARVERKLASRKLAVVAEHKAEAARFWQGLSGTTTLTGGPSKVWLDARLEPSLDVSVPMIGAPAAWERGHTGGGVTVAVLDTGVDAEHPDLAGRIAQAQDFTGVGDTGDPVGHGTHVASTIVGSGAASDGRYKGVAADVRLAAGKVCVVEGCPMSAILAGMEWAARDVRARVVNMSLGGSPTDGTDPLSTAVNDLTSQHGTLFVVSAGNRGRDQSVSRPAAATAALAVGSVTKDGGLSEFSSRGPRVGDGAVKPEIAAPGSDIVAARARDTQGGEPVGEHYMRASGTSMAAPHVAGAAAIVAGQHPDWTADQLKAALVGSAAPVTDAGAYAVGGGLVDLDRATTQRITAAPAAVNGYLKWPDRQRQRHTVSYRNDTDTPVTLSLSLELADTAGNAPPSGLATLSTSSITVPANGTADVTITFTPRSGRPGAYGGVLTASDGTTRLRTPVSAYDEPEMYDLTVNLLDRNGATPEPFDNMIEVVRLDAAYAYFPLPGERLRLPAGRYSILAGVHTRTEGQPLSVSTLSNPELRLRENTTLTFDARLARRLTISTDQPTARDGYWEQQRLVWAEGLSYPYRTTWGYPTRFSEAYAWSTPGVSSPAFGYADLARLQEPAIELFVEQPQRFEVPAYWFDPSPHPDGTWRRAAVYAGAGRPEDLAGLDVRDKLVVLELPWDTTYEEAWQRIRNVADAGGVMVAISVTGGRALAGAAARPVEHAATEPESAALPTLIVHDPAGQRFVELVRSGGVQTSFTGRSSSAHHYELAFPHAGRVPDDLDYAVRTADLAAVRMVWHGHAPDAGTMAAQVQAFGTEVGLALYWFVPEDGEWVQHFTPGAWHVTSVQPIPGPAPGPWPQSVLSDRRELAGGSNHEIRWNAAVSGPGFAGTTSDELGDDHPWACRDYDLLNVNVPLFSDAAGHARPANQEPGLGTDIGSTRLYRDGELIGSTALPGRGIFFASYAAADYRLTADVARDNPVWPTSTRVSGSWTFRGEGLVEPGCHALPLLAVRFAPAVDLRNSAPGGGEFSFPVTVPRQDGPAQITALELEVSYDDGATWQPATVAPDGEAWRATVTHPDSGFASLRARAADADGNTVEQTIIRAYQIGG